MVKELVAYFFEMPDCLVTISFIFEFKISGEKIICVLIILQMKVSD